jgi:hypothetical protein
MGTLTVLSIILVVGFFMTLLFKLGPLYVNDWTIQSVMAGVAESAVPEGGGAYGIADRIGKGLNMNNIDAVTSKDFKIARTGADSYQVTLDYEQRKHLFLNIDVLLTFSHQVDVGGQ